jgi:hypothetical protein
MTPLHDVYHPFILCGKKQDPILCFIPLSSLVYQKQQKVVSLISHFNSVLMSIPARNFESSSSHRRHVTFQGVWGKGVHVGVHEFSRFVSTSATALEGPRQWLFYQESGRVEEVLKGLKSLWEYLDSCLLALFPNLYLVQKCLATDNGNVPTPFDSAFQTCALNRHPHITSIHTDDNEFITAVFIGGDSFQGGALVVPQINVRLCVKPGDMVWIFKDLIHYVEQVTVGVRHSMSLYSKHVEKVKQDTVLTIPAKTQEILSNIK